MTPITGKNVVLQFMYDGDYQTFACALDCSLQTTTRTKSVKTIGDGVWNKTRGQGLSWKVALTGLVVLNETTLPKTFDILDYQTQMVDIQLRMIFEDTDNGLMKVVTGTALPIDSNIGGTSEGFASGTLDFEGQGAYIISNSTGALCNLVVTDLTSDFHTVTVTYTGSDELLRFEYSINGGARQIAYSNPFAVDPSIPSLTPTDVQVWPICDNGQDGTSFTKTLTFD